MRKLLVILFIPLIFYSCVLKKTEKTDSESSLPVNRIVESDLVYMGAFRLPDGISETSTWEWGGTAMTYFPKGDPDGPSDGYPGSIFGTGHAWEHRVSEISIPVPVISNSINPLELNTAATLGQFADILNASGLEIPRTGLQYLPPQKNQNGGKVYFCIGEHMQEGEKRGSHGMFNPNLSNPEKKGLWRIDNLLNYVTTDYMFEIPKNWADKYVGGKYLATGRFRDGGQGAMGPSLIAIAPWENGSAPANNAVLDAKTLLLYENVYLDKPHIMDDYHHSDEWSGGAWITKGDKAAVLFIGTKGIGDCWYGFSNGVKWEEPYPAVPDYPHDDRGWWSTEFRAKFIFYDPADLAMVASGKKESFEIQPYLAMDMEKYLFNDNFRYFETSHGTEKVQRKYRFGACSFDRNSSFLYVFELFADGDKPVVHCWKIR